MTLGLVFRLVAAKWSALTAATDAPTAAGDEQRAGGGDGPWARADAAPAAAGRGTSGPDTETGVPGRWSVRARQTAHAGAAGRRAPGARAVEAGRPSAGVQAPEAHDPQGGGPEPDVSISARWAVDLAGQWARRLGEVATRTGDPTDAARADAAAALADAARAFAGAVDHALDAVRHGALGADVVAGVARDGAYDAGLTAQERAPADMARMAASRTIVYAARATSLAAQLATVTGPAGRAEVVAAARCAAQAALATADAAGHAALAAPDGQAARLVLEGGRRLADRAAGDACRAAAGLGDPAGAAGPPGGADAPAIATNAVIYPRALGG